MPEMNEYLAKFYGTGKTAAVADTVPSDADLEKQASVDLFMKIASEQEIPLDTMSDAEVQHLYSEFVKAAGENPFAKKDEGEEKKDEKKDEEKEEDEKKAAAQAEFASRKEASVKVAEADYLGRVIAHSFVQELGNITKEASPKALNPATLATKAHTFSHKAREAVSAAASKVKKPVMEHLERTGKHLGGKTERNSGPNTLYHHSHDAAARGAAAHAAGGAALAGGAAALHEKKAAFDEIAGNQAVALAAENGWDGDEAIRKVAAVLELGLLGESEKVASAADYETGVSIRALELLETAGYPVTWTE